MFLVLLWCFQSHDGASQHQLARWRELKDWMSDVRYHLAVKGHQEAREVVEKIHEKCDH